MPNIVTSPHTRVLAASPAKPAPGVSFVGVAALAGCLAFLVPLAVAQPTPPSSPGTKDQAEGEVGTALVAPEPRMALKDCVAVRRDPGFIHSELGRLALYQRVTVDRKLDEWLHLERGGWVHAEQLGPLTKMAPPDPTSGGNGRVLARWSLLDVNGMLIEVTELSHAELCAFKSDLAASELQQSDWTLLRLRIGVPAGDHEFRYSPGVHATLVVDNKGARFPSIRVQGPIEKLPSDVRQSLEPRIILPGEAHDVVLLFRPALEVQEIAEVWMRLGSRPQQLLRAP